MNHVEIKYTYFSSKPDVLIDGEKANPYSELVSILSRPFLESAPQIITCLDNEIYDDYQLDLYATKFQYEMLCNFAIQSEYCKKINYHEIESLYSKRKLIERLSSICKENNIPFQHNIPMKVYCLNSGIAKYLPNEFVHTEVPCSDVGIFSDNEPISVDVRIPALFAESLSIIRKNGRPAYTIPRNGIEDFLNFCLFEYVDRPTVLECLTALRYANLSSIQQTELTAIKTNEPAYYIGTIPSMLDQGDQLVIEFVSYPENIYSIRVENPDCVSYQGNTIFAKLPGTTSINVYKNGSEIIASKPITVVGHQYAQEIRLIPRFEYLMRNQKSRIDVVITPVNAEDANKLVWKVSDPSILQINDDGSVTALENGKATVTVSGHSATATVSIEVKPVLQSIRFSPSAITVKTGETVILACETVPADAPTDKFVWDLDNSTIATVNPSKYGNRCQVVASANYEGKGNIRCYDPDSKIGAICNLEVVSKEKATKAGKIALSCWMAGIMLPYVLPVSTIASIYGLTSDPEPAHKKRYMTCLVGSIATLLLWLVAAGL